MDGVENQVSPEAIKAARESEWRNKLIETLGLENLGPEEIDNILKQLRVTVINQEYGHDVNKGNLAESGDFIKKYKPEFASFQTEGGQTDQGRESMVKINIKDGFAIVEEGKDLLCYPVAPFERTRLISIYQDAFEFVPPKGEEDQFDNLDSRFLARLKVARIEPARLENAGPGRWIVKEKGKIFYE